MIGHTFLYSAPIRKIKEIISWGDIGDIRYISARRLNLGLFQKDINVAWDLAPHDISIVLHIMEEMPNSVNCSATPTLPLASKMSLPCASTSTESDLPASKAVGLIRGRSAR